MSRVYGFAAVFLFLGGFGAAWSIQGWRYGAEMAVQAETMAKAHTARVEAIREEERVARDKIIEAHNNAVERRKAADAAARAAAVEVDGLREQLAGFDDRVSEYSEAAIRERATTLNGLLGDCAIRYQGMAATAQRHADDVKLLLDAWPGG